MEQQVSAYDQTEIDMIIRYPRQQGYVLDKYKIQYNYY